MAHLDQPHSSDHARDQSDHFRAYAGKPGEVREYVRNLIAHDLPQSAEIHDYCGAPGGYWDESFLLDNEEIQERGYHEDALGRASENPYPLSPAEVEALIRGGAKDCRSSASQQDLPNGPQSSETS